MEAKVKGTLGFWVGMKGGVISAFLIIWNKKNNL